MKRNPCLHGGPDRLDRHRGRSALVDLRRRASDGRDRRGNDAEDPSAGTTMSGATRTGCVDLAQQGPLSRRRRPEVRDKGESVELKGPQNNSTRASSAKASVRDASASTARRSSLRADFNVPLEPRCRQADDARIRAALPTIELLREQRRRDGHSGVPPGASRGPRTCRTSRWRRSPRGSPSCSAVYVAVCARRSIGDDVDGVVGRVPRTAVRSCCSRTPASSRARSKNDDDARRGASPASLIVYVNDAFGAAHRAHASTAGRGAAHLPAYAGLLLEREVTESWTSVLAEAPERPLVVVLGGAKVSDKIGVIDRFLELADKVLIGGAMCFSFFKCPGTTKLGNSLVEEEGIELAASARALSQGREAPTASCVLPTDLVLGQRASRPRPSAGCRRRASRCRTGWMGLDIGPRDGLSSSRRRSPLPERCFWNGPMGAFELEPFAGRHAGGRRGRRGSSAARSRSSAAVTPVAALAQFKLEPTGSSWLSTGGGASLDLARGQGSARCRGPARRAGDGGLRGRRGDRDNRVDPCLTARPTSRPTGRCRRRSPRPAEFCRGASSARLDTRSESLTIVDLPAVSRQCNATVERLRAARAVMVATQNMYFRIEAGAFTGEVSPEMLLDARRQGPRDSRPFRAPSAVRRDRRGPLAARSPPRSSRRDPADPLLSARPRRQRDADETDRRAADARSRRGFRRR